MAPSRISSKDDGLTPEQLQFYHKNGYLVISDFLSPANVATLLDETQSILSSIDLTTHPMTRFSTGQGDAQTHVGDEYFLTSGDKIRTFFEEDAFDPHTHALTAPVPQSINKIGHALHLLSPPFRAVTLAPRNAALARSLAFRDPRVLQSMVICKQPRVGGPVPPHQDSTFLYTSPPSAVGFWFALEDCHAGNGCLGVVEGSHRWAAVQRRFVRMPEGGTGFVDVAGAGFPDGGERDGEGQREGEEDYTLLEVKAGALVLIHGNLLHKSERNTSGKSRFIYTFHVIEGENKYDGRNWLQPSGEEGFTRLFQTGEGR